ncbi:hypothetical protein HDU93_007889 [Gonapodya sp. JEL0774]|nr:hypothetical protein HDU93_007889 [Gonapodya sp. JEL0774]
MPSTSAPRQRRPPPSSASVPQADDDDADRYKRDILLALEKIQAEDGPRMKDIRERASKEAFKSLYGNAVTMLILLTLAFALWGVNRLLGDWLPSSGQTRDILGPPTHEPYVIYNAMIYTVDDKLPLAGAVAVKGGRITAVAKTLRELKLGSEWVVARVADLRHRLLSYIQDHAGEFYDVEGTPKPNKWLYGRGWDQTKFPGAQFPTKEDLDVDSVLAQFPIVLMRVDCGLPSLILATEIKLLTASNSMHQVHAYLINDRALNIVRSANPSLLTAAVPGGHIPLSLAGSPTGIFIDAAMALVDVTRPKDARVDDLVALERAARAVVAKGVTSYHDAAVRPDDIETFKIYGMLLCDPPDSFCGDSVVRIDDYLGRGKFTLKAVKQILDGALGSWGASLWEPYEDKPGEKGLERVSLEMLKNLTWQWVNAVSVGAGSHSEFLYNCKWLMYARAGRFARMQVSLTEVVQLGDHNEPSDIYE